MLRVRIKEGNNEHGEPYIPIWGGVEKIVKNIKDLIKG